MENNQKNFPTNFLLDITKIPGSSEKVCLLAIEHYRSFINYPDPIVNQIAQSMVGNLTQYYAISHPGSPKFEQALPHLSVVANFMDSKNTPSMDIESTARIKSFYSTYEKLLLKCSKAIEHNEYPSQAGLIQDIIATRDVLHPRYQLKKDPQAFFKNVYGAILQFMELIDELGKENPEYGFEEISKHKRIQAGRPKIYDFSEDLIEIPNKDFIDYALEIKQIPPIYRYLAELSNISNIAMMNSIVNLKSTTDYGEIFSLSIIQALKSQIQKEGLVNFRNVLEDDLIRQMPKHMYKDYKNKSLKDFLYIYKSSLKPEEKDMLNVVSHIDSKIANGSYQIDINSCVSSNPVSQAIIFSYLGDESQRQNELLEQQIRQLKDLDLVQFEEHLSEAQKIHRYSLCVKDYMRNPKDSGYQAFHLTVHTPFGSYEKQFRTEDQDNFAEHGYASHSKTYKPYEKENFHRLKIPTYLMPARDEHGDIITPISLKPLDFQNCLEAYYHFSFSDLAGVPMELFEKIHPAPDDYDEALFELGEPDTDKLTDRVVRFFQRIVKKKSKTIETPNDSRNYR